MHSRFTAPLDGFWGRQGRRLWTVLSFALFGLGAGVFGLVVFPLLLLLVWNRQRRQRLARRLISVLFGFFIRFMGLFVLSWELDGLPLPEAERGSGHDRPDEPGGGKVVVANHPTLIDAVFLLWCFPGADCVVKASHWRNPLMMFSVRAAGYIPNNDDEVVLEEGVRRVRSGRTLLLFPQGTRTRPGEEPSFRRGGAVIAARAGAPLLPVRIRCEPPALRKGEPWLAVPSRRGHFTITALPAENPADWLPAPADSRHSERAGTRALTEHLKGLLLNGC
ncbi:MAG: lysophospholipid acyltransferase family protein [Xanthomonadales bacterium]|nr:lysophospholipid acyltransferase family protein [Xanthomonadales bacterium]